MELNDRASAALFERIVTPHVPAAWNLARWLLRDPHDAEDVLQEACLRSFAALASYRGGESKGWFLAIVRNLCHDCLRQKRTRRIEPGQEQRMEQLESESPAPIEQLERRAETLDLRRAIEQLPAEHREIVILREFEGLSYKEIAQVAKLPMGTVMSRLARAREKLVQLMSPDRANHGEAQ